MLLKNAQIYTMEEEQVIKGDILIQNGRIAAIGHVETEDEVCIDLNGKRVYPGMVEAHCHLGMEESAIRSEGNDVNESSDPITPQVRGIDGCYPLDETIVNARNAGITTVAAGPGSANVIGGTFVAYKTYGVSMDEMAIKNPVAMKCAFGENPKRRYMTSRMSTRMTNAALIREALQKAALYMAKKEAAGDDVSKLPAFDQKSESLIPVLKGELPLKAHAHQANDIFTAIRIAKEFHTKLTLEHVTEGHLIVEELVKENLPLAVGPTFGHATKVELLNKSWTTPGILAKAGCHVSIISDAPVTPLHNLPLYAGMAMKAGMDPYDALRAITINAAEHIGVADRVGSLETGKDADLVICKGSPMEISGVVKYVFINGELVE